MGHPHDAYHAFPFEKKEKNSKNDANHVFPFEEEDEKEEMKTKKSRCSICV